MAKTCKPIDKDKITILNPEKNKIVFRGMIVMEEDQDKSMCICSPDNCSCNCIYPTAIQSTTQGVSDGRSTVMYNQNCIG